jgi:hypothetical protein
MFSRLSLSIFMSYLPLLSFGPSVTVPGSAYLLTAWSASLALLRVSRDREHGFHRIVSNDFRGS